MKVPIFHFIEFVSFCIPISWQRRWPAVGRRQQIGSTGQQGKTIRMWAKLYLSNFQYLKLTISKAALGSRTSPPSSGQLNRHLFEFQFVVQVPHTLHRVFARRPCPSIDVVASSFACFVCGSWKLICRFSGPANVLIKSYFSHTLSEPLFFLFVLSGCVAMRLCVNNKRNKLRFRECT